MLNVLTFQITVTNTEALLLKSGVSNSSEDHMQLYLKKTVLVFPALHVLTFLIKLFKLMVETEEFRNR